MPEHLRRELVGGNQDEGGARGRQYSIEGYVPLAKSIQEGVEPPEELERDILLVGRVHWIYAPAASGKTWLWLWMVKRCIERGERVLVFDSENGERIVAERLGALGVDVNQIDELLLYYPFPYLTTEKEVVADYEALLDDFQPSLVVFDALVSFLGSAGLDESSNPDLVAWAACYTAPARKRDMAVVVFDHVPHEGDHARGASRKRDEADVMWALKNPIPFDRDTVGRITLRRDKDREAWLPGRLGFSVGGSEAEGGFIFRRSAGAIEEPNPEDGLTDTERRVLDTLRDDFGVQGAKANEWMKAAKKRKVSEAGFWRSKRTITARELVIVTSDSRFVAKPSPTPEGPDSRESGLDREDSVQLSGLSERYHDSDDSALLSLLSPPFRGDSSDSATTPRDSPGPAKLGSLPREEFNNGSIEQQHHGEADRSFIGPSNNGKSRAGADRTQGVRLTDEQARRVQRLVGEGMAPRLAREEVLRSEPSEARKGDP
jgi:hypothetical protein